MGMLRKGENAPLTEVSVDVRFSWACTAGVPDLDLSALLVAPNGRVRSEADLVFFNQPLHPSGAVRRGARTEVEGRCTERVEVHLAAVPEDVAKVVLFASSDGSVSFGQVREGLVEVVNGGSESVLLGHQPSPGGSETCLVLGELYRRDGNWRFRAVSQGYASGMAGLVTDFGVAVEQAPPTAPVIGGGPVRSTAPVPPQVTPAAQPPAGPPRMDHPRRPVRRTAPPVSASAAPPDMRHPSRRRTDVAPPASPVAAGAVPPPPPAPPSASSPGGRPIVAEPALRTAAEAWAPVSSTVLPQASKGVADAIEAAAGAFFASAPDTSPELSQVDAAVSRLQEAWKTRFRKQPHPATPSSEPWTESAGTDLAGWLRDAAELVGELASNHIALTSNGRAQYRSRQRAAYQEIMQRVGAVCLGVRQRSADTMASRGPGSGTAAATQIARRIPAVPPPPAPIGPFAEPVAQGALATGIGPLLVSVGTATATTLHLESQRPGPNPERKHQVPLPGVPLPVVLDLDHWGGFVCDAPVAAESVVTQLLAALPAGQLQLRIFDPERLGESANFLYGLGEAAARIIGEKVKTTPKELAELLVETEEHITFVTQKYLQGSFETLTAYNLASGDVAEPYRMLVIHDYPSGFSRDTSYDQEQLERLGKIIAAGPRCGVFTVVVASAPAVKRASQPLGQLPWFFPGFVPPGVLRTIAGDEPVARGLLRANGSATSEVSWRWQPPPGNSPATHDSLIAHVERGLRTAGDVQVDPTRVAELAAAELHRAVQRGTREAEVTVDPFATGTWWHGSSLDDIAALVGRQGAASVARLELDSKTASSILIGGRPGSGKSVLLHALIMSLAQQYGPDELELYLVDFKEGVEFKQYAAHHLPQAKVVAIESEREFGVSVLESLAAEIVQRGQLFREAGSGEETNLGHFRRNSGQRLPRIVLVIDEFQVMFDRDDKLGAQAAELLERVLRTGRAFGVHVILASQTIAGMPALGRHLPNLIPTRVALQVAEADSRLLLSEENADAKLLSRPGEAILNTKGGLRDANQRFQATYWSPEQRGWVLERLAELATSRGSTRRPVVFEGQKSAHVSDVDPASFRVVPGKSIAIPVGTPMTLGGPVCVDLRREPGGNLLLLNESPDVLAVLVGCAAAAQVQTTVLDFGGGDESWERALSVLALAPAVELARRREAASVLDELVKAVDERQALRDYGSPARILVVHGLHRAREIDPAAEYDDDSETAKLKRVLRDGPEVGVHVVAWVDKRMSLERRLSSEALREFGLRLTGPMSREDSIMLIDADDAAALRPGQGILDDHDLGKRFRLRLFDLPTPEWLESVAAERFPG